MNKQKVIVSFSFLMALAFLFNASALTTVSVTKSGRRVQLDGFLLEWKKDSAKALGSDSRWTWDALSTKEGLTGYFKAPASAGNDWTFIFLPRQLSSYTKMRMSLSPDSSGSFYRVSQPANNLDSSITAEWVIPWKDISLDSSGNYKLGITASNSRGDTLPALILIGRAFDRKKNPSPWGKVQAKAILLIVLLAALFYTQKKAKRKTMKRRKSGASAVNGEGNPPR